MKIDIVNSKQDTITHCVRLFGLSTLFIISVVVPPFIKGQPSLCIFKALFGIPCAGCGMTRAFLFLGHGDIGQAFLLNPSSLLVFFMLILFWVNELTCLLSGKFLKLRATKIETVFAGTCTGILVAIVWVYNMFFNLNV